MTSQGWLGTSVFSSHKPPRTGREAALAHTGSLPKITELSSRFLGKDTPAWSPGLQFYPVGRQMLPSIDMRGFHLTWKMTLHLG